MDLRSLQITPDLLRLVAEVDEFKGTWSVLRTLTPERLNSLRHVATIESIGSSTRIEGARLSDRQVEVLLQGLSSRSFASRDEEEVAGYAQVMDIVHDSFADIPFTENHIKQLHSALLRHSGKDSRHRGEYKKHPNNVEAFDADGNSLGVIFETTSPFDTPREMADLVRWTRDALEDKSQHALIVCAVFTVAFLAIHPFQDGNGRLSRVLTTLLLLKSGYGYVPYSSMESVIERNKEAYYLALRRTQTTLTEDVVDWSPWLRFFLISLKRQKDHLISKLDGLQTERFRDQPEDSVMILEFVEKHGRITTSAALKLTGVPRPTVKLRLSSLVSDGLLVLHGGGRGAYYARPQ